MGCLLLSERTAFTKAESGGHFASCQHPVQRAERAPRHASISQGDVRRALDRPGIPTGSQRHR